MQLSASGMIPAPSDRQRALLDHARALTAAPGDMAQEHVDALRSVGLSDAEILSANLIVAYFNLVDRIALGLGVETSEEEASGYND